MIRISRWIAGLAILLAGQSCVHKKNPENVEGYVGSVSCIECHERFYQLWAPSMHGKAMQPVHAGFVREYALPESKPMGIEGNTYQIVYEDSLMVILETAKEGMLKKYPLQWALGGPNVYTFLVALEQGKLQTIPLAYDMNRLRWFNYPESAIRHFTEAEGAQADEALPWRDRMYAFNTACYKCHVSQVSSNYDLATDTYHTTWKEPGINCETCHGPSGEHVRVCLEAEKEGRTVEDLKLIVTSTFTPEEHNSSCAVCHAKGGAITKNYVPPEPYFDHFTLATLEDPDFYPDGRDLGENYTYTGWKMNPCVQKSDLHCVTCHTSSGRNRFKDKPNEACLMCHTDKRENLSAHTGHLPESPGSTCVNCHAPRREFVGHFLRSDHSFRPPMPEATLKFGSPNACNQCHDDKTAQWANNVVKKRPNGNYQEETLYWAQLIKDAREGKWGQLEKMREIVEKNQYNEVVVTSLVRLMANCPDDSKWSTLLDAAKNNPSPLVRAAAATSLNGNYSEAAKNALLTAAADDIRLVRVSAAAALAGFGDDQFLAGEKQRVAGVTEEYMQSMVARPDDWSSHYNLGIFHQNRGDVDKALEAYNQAARLYPESLMPLINSSVLHAYTGNTAAAESSLNLALEHAPRNEAANLNLGLLLAEQGKTTEAEKALRTVLEVNPNQAVAAYNLSVISAGQNIQQAVEYAQIAATSAPEEPKYAYTLAYYQLQNQQKNAAINTLKKIIDIHPQYLTAVSLLADVYLRDGNTGKARALYEKALKTEGISAQDRAAIQQALQQLPG